MTVLNDDPPLFQKGDLFAYLEARKKAAFDEVGRLQANDLLSLPFPDLAASLVDRVRIEPLELDESNITTDQDEATIKTSRIPDGRWIYGEHQPTVAGFRFTFFIPFRGDSALFALQPNAYTMSPPRGTVGQSEVVVTLTTITPDAQAIQGQLQQRLAGIRQWIQNQRGQVDEFNRTIPNQASERLQARKEQLLRAANTVAAIGFPLRKRSGAASTFAAPEVRRKVSVIRQSSSTQAMPAFRPEPALASEDYEHILGVIENMALVLERSPSAFTTMGEEDLRQHFLVQLNGHYEGAATAETFNVSGKTDILIRSDGKNIFVAECKFWKGPAGFTATIDQLLGYASWRDTKTAVIVFNRDTEMTTVLEKIPVQLKAHSNYKRSVDAQKETRFRAVFSHPGDASRELTMTVLVFDVPG